MLYTNEELWKFFAADADDCEDGIDEPTTYEQYVRKFIEVAPDRNELYDLDKFFVRVKVPEDIANDEAIADVFLNMVYDSSPVNSYKAVLEVWLEKTKMGKKHRIFWKSCLHGLFLFYGASTITKFLHSEGFVYWWTPIEEPIDIMPSLEAVPSPPPLTSSSSYSCIIS